MRKLMVEQRKRVEELIKSIKEETNGYKLGKPWRHSDKSLTCVIPVLKTTEDHPREYITITEAKKVVITDTGNINEARIKNEEDKPIFLRLGEILAGGTQERAVTSSRVIFPGEETLIPIACIHASKGIHSGATFHFDGYASHKDYSYIYNVHNYGKANQQESWNLDRTYTSYADEVLRKHGFQPAQQEPNYSWSSNNTSNIPGLFNSLGSFSTSRSPSDSSRHGSWSSDSNTHGTPNPYWQDSTTSGDGIQDSLTNTQIPPQDVRLYTQQIGQIGQPFINQADDLTSKHKEVNDLLEDIMKKVPLFEDQIGLALIDPDGFKCLDCYDVKLSYKAIKEALVGKETAAISDTDEKSVFEYKPDVAKKAINKVLEHTFEENIVHESKNSKTITLNLDGYMGEAVLLGNKIIHLVITRKE